MFQSGSMYTGLGLGLGSGLGLGLGLGFRVSVSVWLDGRRLWTRRKLRCHTCSTRSGGQGLGLVEMIVDAYHVFEVLFFFFLPIKTSL